MGGAISKDPGRIHYRIHNIYLNYVTTYGRLPPNKPFTIHQKSLFLFWMSVSLLWCFLVTYKLFCKLANRKFERQLNEQSVEEGVAKKADTPVVNGIHHNAVANGNVCNTEGTTTSNQKVEVEEDKKEDNEEEETEQKLSLYEKTKVFFTATSPEQPSFQKFLGRLILFGMFMFYIWLCDHLHLWPKVEKQYSRDTFIFLFLVLVLVAAIFSIKKTKDSFLNRDQTEEWKGWMQVQFVWYHYFDAQEVFNSIRCYIAAYVWMTGYGNFCFFWNKKDYSIFRLLKMMFRLNFLVLAVMAVTNSEFVRYYICAMHTYWFLSVWAVMAVLNKYNTNRIFMIGKLVVYTLVNALIFEIPGAPEKVFIPFSFILNVKGKLDYWIYRSTLDHWTTLVGIIVAYNFNNIEKLIKFIDDDTNTKQQIFRKGLRMAITLISVAVFVLWFHFILMLDRETYVKAHPYSSPIPVLVYICLRNLHPILRTYNLDVFSWLGKITLETYLSQIHMYMIGDAKKILVYLPNYPLLNFFLATIIYIFVSYNLFHLTVFFSSYLLPRDLKIIAKNFVIGFLWLGTCYFVSGMLTWKHVWSTEKTGLEFLLWRV